MQSATFYRLLAVNTKYNTDIHMYMYIFNSCALMNRIFCVSVAFAKCAKNKK